ncbi:MAG: transporter [Bacteroidetes bacterium]|nr:transporter [Bacteroidota bacterium]
MKRIRLILLLLFYTLFSFSQEIITDRPDQTESAQVVPLYTLQIESGTVYEEGLAGNNTFTVNSTLFRFGLFEDFELRLGTDYSILSSDVTTQISKGFNPLYLGMKVQITDEKGFYPGIAFLGGLSLPFFATTDFKTDELAPDFRFSISHSLAEWLSLGYNLGIEWNGEDNQPLGLYTITLAFGLADWLGFYMESYGFVWNPNGDQHMADAGFTFLLKDNFQLDVSSGVGLNINAPEFYAAAGFSWRIPD